MLVTKGQVVQLVPIVIPQNTSGIYPTQGPLNISANGLHLLNRLSVDRSGSTVLTCSTTARVMVRINREDAPWIPFSFIANSGDANVISATIAKLWFNVTTPDAANPILFVAVNNTGIACPGAGNSVGSYSVPAGAQGPLAEGQQGSVYGGATAFPRNNIRLPVGPAPNVAVPTGGSGSRSSTR